MAIHELTTPPSLEEAQRLVGGYVQLLQLDADTQMLIDEEGKIKGKPVNTQATDMASPTLFFGDVVVGDVVLLRGKAQWS